MTTRTSSALDRLEGNFISRNMTWRNVFMAAGIAIVTPYLFRRLMPLISNFRNTTMSDVVTAGRDAARDVADDMNVGGVSGKVKRAADRVGDRLSH